MIKVGDKVVCQISFVLCPGVVTSIAHKTSGPEYQVLLEVGLIYYATKGTIRLRPHD